MSSPGTPGALQAVLGHVEDAAQVTEAALGLQFGRVAARGHVIRCDEEIGRSCMSCVVKEVERDQLGRAQRVIESVVDHLEVGARYAATSAAAQLSQLAEAGARRLRRDSPDKFQGGTLGGSSR